MLTKDIKVLIKILEESELFELEVSTFWGRQNIRLRKNREINSNNINTQNIAQEIDIEQSQSQQESFKNKTDINNSEHDNEKIEHARINSNKNNLTIKSPLVGTFYKSSKPDEQPFVKEGDLIKSGQIICIIEAMKIFNEIESEFSGKILKILINDGTPVEFDQDLFIISPE